VSKEKITCSKGLWNDSVPGITFDENGISNYSIIFNQMLNDYPKGEKGKKDWERFVFKIKTDAKGKKYDCIIGVSGGTDSSYLLHFAKEQGLNPLAVFLDNGWSSNTSLMNIEKMTQSLNIDLYTHVIDYEEVKSVLKSYLKAGLPWADSPTDIAIRALLFKMAAKFNLKYVLTGHDFRSEGFQPTEWTYSDEKQLRYLNNRFGNVKLKTFPLLSLTSFVYYTFIKKIQYLKPFFYLEYSKQSAKELLITKYKWEDYGGHHYENIFTKFIISFWLYEKFGIDKRIITFSAQVLSGELTRESAMAEMAKIPYSKESIDQDINYISKKLDLSRDEFDAIFKNKNANFNDYPSYFNLLKFAKKSMFYFLKILLPNKPLFMYQYDSRNKSKK
jgi:N-acetyl sugar amidotransferase